MNTINTEKIKKDFQIFKNQPDLVYLDSGATSFTPDTVIKSMDKYYYEYRANTSRGVYELSEKATQKYEEVRQKVKNFINANDENEIVFTSGTTASINLVAFGLKDTLKHDDEILITASEHHANLIPWQRLVSDGNLKVLNVSSAGEIDLDEFKSKISKKTKVLAISHVSNVLGTIYPVKKLIKIAKKINPQIITLVDGAQSVPHIKTDVLDLDCDFLAFSAHKMCGPTGVGVLYGKKHKLEKLIPIFTGGDMIEEVTFKKSTFTQIPHRLEAGSANISGVIGLGSAIDYTESIGIENIRNHETKLLAYTIDKLKETFGDEIEIFGPIDTKNRSGVISFKFKSYHPHDIASILDSYSNVCVRAGNHCAMPLHNEVLRVLATTRASFYFYNTQKDANTLVDGLKKIEQILK